MVVKITTTVLRPFVWDYPGEPVPEETLTHPPAWSSCNLYQLLPSTTIHSILLVPITCLAIFLHNLFPCPLGLEPSTSYSIDFFTQSVSSSRSTCPYHRSLFCSSISIISSIPSLCLNSLNFSSLFAEVPPHFQSWQARSHFHVAYYFAHSCHTASLS